MIDLIGPLGIPGAAAALVLMLERGFVLGKAIYSARANGKNGHNGNGNGVELQKQVAALTAQLIIVDRDLVAVREDLKGVPDQIGRGMSSVVARCEEIIDPMRRQLERIENRVDQHIGSGP